ncbi:MAG TPA: hypothetical protein VHM65_07145, partial [Candidatus Lustribacter sp.]|nr:hypothetical protein [Candidatus Lustribacter sp.]
VSAALEEFGDRWDRGMNNLAGDVEEMAGRLGKIAMTYAELDTSGAERMSALAGSMRTVRVLG